MFLFLKAGQDVLGKRTLVDFSGATVRLGWGEVVHSRMIRPQTVVTLCLRTVNFLSASQFPPAFRQGKKNGESGLS